MTSDFASLLIAARGTLSVVGAAERGAISPRMLQHYERGRKLPKADTLENIISGWTLRKADAAALREAHRAACVAKNQARVAK